MSAPRVIPIISVPEDDAAARTTIENELETSYLVEAAAGTGKTTELVRRIVSVLKTGRSTVDRIVAVTFTRKAAGEMKLRLRHHLDAARDVAATDEERRNLEEAMARLEEARIGTIHSFCAELLRERPVEAGVDPGFKELSEDEAQALYQRAFRSWIEHRLGHPSVAIGRVLVRRGGDESPLDALRSAGWRLIEWRDFPAPWTRRPFDLRAEVDALVNNVRELAQMAEACPKTNDPLRIALEPAVEFCRRLDRAEAVRTRDPIALEPLLAALHRDLARDKRKGRGAYAPQIPREQVAARRDELMQQLADFRICASADLASLLREELNELLLAYDACKQRAGALDFVDLLIRARDLVRGNAEVRAHLQRRFTHIFVDEFQDTDPLQAEILLLLSSDDPAATDWLNVRPVPGKLFLVGDPKQAIYRFRRADPLLYQSVRDALVQRRVGLLYLTRSYRAVEPLQQAVNLAFERAIRRDAATGQPDYVPLHKVAEACEGQPSLIALPVPEPYAKVKMAKSAIERSVPAAVTSFVEWLLNASGWRVRDPDMGNEWQSIRPRDICLLFRRFISFGRDITREYVHGLENRGITHVLVGARSFHQREEVETLRAALAAIEWPDDELSVFATLKGSLFAISDETLLRFRHEVGRLHPFGSWRAQPVFMRGALGAARVEAEGLANFDAELHPVGEALAVLADLHRRRNRRPVAETLNELLELTRAHAGFALRPAGHQVLGNVQRVCEMARRFETQGSASFRAFVEHLDAHSEREDTAGVSVIEEGADGVRLMTVHTAKGLEFPVVILADITTGLARKEPERYIDPQHGVCAVSLLGCSPWDLLDHQAEERARDEAEGVRVAYVAATRARDLLVVPAVGDERFPRNAVDGWVSPLNEALYPPDEYWRKSQPAPGCPAFGEDTVMARPAGVTAKPVRPGRFRARTGHEVVWWDPALLRLDAPANFGLRQEDILAEDEGGAAAEEGLRNYQTWAEHRAARIQSGSRPLIDLLLASVTAEDPPDAPEVQFAAVAARAKRPSGRRFGALVHSVLAHVDLRAAAEDIRCIAQFHARALGASDDEIGAAVETVSAALEHNLLHRGRSAERIYRELPLTIEIAPGRVLEAAADLVFRDAAGWTVVDFKTDMDSEVRRKLNVRQLRWYLHAVSRTLGGPVSGWLLSI